MKTLKIAKKSSKFIIALTVFSLFGLGNIAYASTRYIASTEDRSMWQLWDRYNNDYYYDYGNETYYTNPNPGVRFKFDVATAANSAILPTSDDDPLPGFVYPNPGIVSTDSNVLFKGAYFVVSMDAFTIPAETSLPGGTLSVKVRIKANSKNPSFLFPADEMNYPGMEANTCDTAPNATLYFEDSDGGSYVYLVKGGPSGSTGSKPLSQIASAKGVVTLTAPLDSASWITDGGTFEDAVAGMDLVGITIGGGCFAATGAALNGASATSAQFDIIEVALIK